VGIVGNGADRSASRPVRASSGTAVTLGRQDALERWARLRRAVAVEVGVSMHLLAGWGD